MRTATLLHAFLAFPLLLLPAPAASAQSFDDAHWIWLAGSGPAGERCTLRRTLTLAAAPVRAIAAISADNHFRLQVNGAPVGRGDDWSHATRIDLTRALRAGENTIEARCANEGDVAAFLFAAELEWADGTRTRVVSDTNWLAVRELPEDEKPDGKSDGAVEWKPARDLGAYGVAPWGRVAPPLPAMVVDPLPGFRVEPVVEGIGSIDAFTRIGPGRLIASVEGNPLLELVDADGDGTTETATVFTDAVQASQGLLWRDDALFTTGDGPAGHGLYRVARGAAPELWVRYAGDLGEHGPHAIQTGPDGALYVMAGNHATLADPPAASSPYRTTYEGHLLPPYLDPRGHAVQCKAPGGFLIRVEPSDTGPRKVELWCAGFRNAYDFAFGAGGDCFTFDSDMEWDVGLPWYRPCRLLHLVAGGEYGWRTGSKVWPESYADSLPTTLDTGRGSPTGMCLCTGDRFPARFRGAILAGDWSQGQILAFELTPRGATFDAKSEILLRGRPLNVTDLAMDEDGSLLFSVGGRGTQGGIHRLIYDGPQEKATPASPPARAARFDDSTEFAALLFALGDDDRYVRFTAGLALERRAPQQWERAALALVSPLARGSALVALARQGIARTEPDRHQPRLAAALRILTEGATGVARLTALRALELLLLDPELEATTAPGGSGRPALDGAPLLALFPTGDRAADRELAQLLAKLGPPGAAAKLWTTFKLEPSREQQIAYAYSLRCATGEWPAGARLELCRWLDHGIAAWSGGMSFEGYLRHLRDDVVAGLAPDDRATLAAEAEAARAAPTAALVAAAAEPRDLDSTLLFVERSLHAPRRSPADGALVFQELCANCHRRFESGKAVGPDLTTIGARFGLRDLLESMIAPSRTISDQYRGVNVFLKSGDVKSGLPLVDDGKTLVLVESSGQKVEIAAGEIASRKPATKSVMPDGQLDRFTLEQVADLCAWLLAAEPIRTPEQPTWRPLFDGKSLTGFEGDLSHWRVEEGTIVGASEGLPAASHLIVSGSFSDFVAEFDLRLGAADANSGFLFRARRVASDRLAGYEADAGAERIGSLVEEGGRGVLAQPKNEILLTLGEPTGWNHFVVSAIGPRIVIEVNGAVSVDLQDPAGAREGFLGFELHAGTRNDLRIRNVRVRSNTPTR